MMPFLDMKQIINLQDGGKVIYIKNFITKKKSEDLMIHLKEHVPWTHGIYKMYGKDIKTPRLLFAMKDANTDITDSYSITNSIEWSNQIYQLKQKVQKETGKTFSYAQLNYYRTGDDYIGYHTDSEVKDGDIIASVSLGANRKFSFQQIKNKEIRYDMILESGSLLIMDDKAAKYNWKHSLPKAKGISERINITFRPA